MSPPVVERFVAAVDWTIVEDPAIWMCLSGVQFQRLVGATAEIVLAIVQFSPQPASLRKHELDLPMVTRSLEEFVVAKPTFNGLSLTGGAESMETTGTMRYRGGERRKAKLRCLRFTIRPQREWTWGRAPGRSQWMTY
eukprot:GHVO01066603.1.p1 GENE.GHVO01066603.1~~GHVO01066603.1.p1  ORF type:complete len:138 (+),score=11.34 GHVO01066603.1:687-1100(+)